MGGLVVPVLVQDEAAPTALEPVAGAQGIPALSPESAFEIDITEPAHVLPIAGVAAFIGLLILPLVESVARWTFPRAAASTGPSFTWRDIALVLLALLSMQVVVGGVVEALDLDLDSLRIALPLTVVWQGAAAAFVLILAARRRYGYAALGLRRGESGWALAYGVTRYVGWGPFLFALMVVTPMLLERVFGIPHETQDVAQMIARAKGLERALVALFAVLLIPLCEELLFRGFLQNALEPRIGAWPAVLMSSLAFALLHGASAAIPIFGLSLILGVTMLHTRRLAACWLVHALHNGLTTGLLFVVPETLLEQAR